MDGWEVMARGAYNKDDETTAFDGDTIGERAIFGTGLLQAAFIDDYEDYSFETRVASPADQPLRGLAGFTYTTKSTLKRPGPSAPASGRSRVILMMFFGDFRC